MKFPVSAYRNTVIVGWAAKRAPIVLVLAALAISACTMRPMPGTMAPDQARAAYQLGPGDRLRIDVFGDKDLSGEYVLDGKGTIAMPLVGSVHVGGLTSSELNAELEQKLSDYMRDPKVSIQILSYRPIYVVGEVRTPGSYPYVDGMTVINAIAIAGGYTYRAEEDLFIVDRKSNGDALAATPQTPLLPGDVVTVRERYF